ncbi:hypothetical protein [Nocardia arizonensis]|uniref:hypothetical protein n=1 Tax=Nocardia arizonensis TaxID=1141647 RepID=UPI000A80146B|nr:hypothetical protein [Nocardia arizonensis]
MLRKAVGELRFSSPPVNRRFSNRKYCVIDMGASADVRADWTFEEEIISMRMIRLFGTALAAAGIALSGAAVASAEPVEPAAVADGYQNPWLDGWGNGSGNLVLGLERLFMTGSGGVKPLPTSGEVADNSWATGSAQLGTALSNFLSTGSGDVKPLPTAAEIADNSGSGAWATGSAQLGTALSKFLSTGSGDVKPLPTSGVVADNSGSGAWATGSAQLGTALSKFLSTGSGDVKPLP